MTAGMGPAGRIAATVIAASAIGAGTLSYVSARHMSATFDEIILVSGGLRGTQLGRWEMITDQPPLMMYAYGLAAAEAAKTLPAEDRPWLFDDRWDYAQQLFFGLGNDTATLLERARLVAAITAALLVLATGFFAWWIAGPLAGGVAASVTALLPDVLAHGGVAYNDVPLALAFLLAVWALDVAARKPTPTTSAVAGLAVATALGVKLSALALVPVAVLLVAAEAWGRRHDPAWRKDLGVALAVGGVSLYLGLVLIYRGDPSLTLFRYNFWRTVTHATAGHSAPAYLLGEVSAGGWWYYFPVAFLFKTPVAFQAMLLSGAVALAAAFRGVPRGWERILAWKERGVLVAALVFGAFLLRSDLNAGFRYALPILPLLAITASVGLVRLWPKRHRVRLAAIGALILLQAVSVLSVFPHLLAYSSLWAGGRDEAHEVLLDSNLDWGQELLELRLFMQEEGVASVRLSYFGSAPPEAYGIEYVALPSFFRLAPERTPGAAASPRFTVISATNLHGLYLQGRDPFAAYRERQPYRILGHSLFVYDDEA